MKLFVKGLSFELDRMRFEYSDDKKARAAVSIDGAPQGEWMFVLEVSFAQWSC